MNKKILNWVIPIVITLLIVCLAFLGAELQKDNKYVFKIQRENVELMYEGARADLVACIDSTIRIYAPTTCMNGLELLRQCESFEVDPIFVLAQGHKESHFGTKGMASKTNSVFNVYAYDGKKYSDINPAGKYSHPDLSIKPFLSLLKSKYLVDGKTEMDLLHEYVDKSGHRYASSEDYENDLTSLYHMYASNEKLMTCFKQYKKYKILAGR